MTSLPASSAVAQITSFLQQHPWWSARRQAWRWEHARGTQGYSGASGPRTASYGRTHLDSRRRWPWRSPAFPEPFPPSRQGRTGTVARACCAAAGDWRGLHS